VIDPNAYLGRNVNEVTAELTALGLSVNRSGEPRPEPAGTVVEINPVGTVSPGQTIQLTFSEGPRQIAVPGGLAGQDEGTVRQRLVEAGLTPVNAGSEVSDQPAGSVLRVDPAEGTNLNEGAEVRYIVSLGPPPTTPPAEDDEESSSPTPDATSPGS
jgi:serine/threonine-protein kinase